MRGGIGERKGRLTDVVEFFQSPLLSFRDPEEDEDERGDIESATRPLEKRSDTKQSKGLTHRSQRHRWG